MNWLDQTVGFFSPRAAMNILRRRMDCLEVRLKAVQLASAG